VTDLTHKRYCLGIWKLGFLFEKLTPLLLCFI
jgi:hypothetical protein